MNVYLYLNFSNGGVQFRPRYTTRSETAGRFGRIVFCACGPCYLYEYMIWIICLVDHRIVQLTKPWVNIPVHFLITKIVHFFPIWCSTAVYWGIQLSCQTQEIRINLSAWMVWLVSDWLVCWWWITPTSPPFPSGSYFQSAHPDAQLHLVPQRYWLHRRLDIIQGGLIMNLSVHLVPWCHLSFTPPCTLTYYICICTVRQWWMLTLEEMTNCIQVCGKMSVIPPQSCACNEKLWRECSTVTKA